MTEVWPRFFTSCAPYAAATDAPTISTTLARINNMIAEHESQTDRRGSSLFALTSAERLYEGGPFGGGVWICGTREITT
jgi:hypothetical protein